MLGIHKYIFKLIHEKEDNLFLVNIVDFVMLMNRMITIKNIHIDRFINYKIIKRMMKID